ncbi:MAG: GNAT family N-acetyltransferase [Clostridia bacterium]|nr:GNAT family N-acetyltransferase [Clostridia bacterium]
MIAFDNHDSRIRYVDLLMERMHLEDIPAHALPEGYRFVFYQPGDRDAWIDIEISARELKDFSEGVRVWQQYYGHVEDTLYNRMLFIENEKGEKVATATAFYDETLPPERGQVHWVAVRRGHQGRGLARPLIAQVLRVMKQRGHSEAMLHTQTTTWVAVRLYLEFGFRPMKENAEQSRAGWRIIRALTGHPALAAFGAATENEILERPVLDGEA